MWVGKWLAGARTAALLVLLSGCSGFFPPLSSNGGGGDSGGGTTTAGDFVYVANGATSTIAAFAVGADTSGAATLTELSSSPYSLSLQPTAMVVTPNNQFLYVAGVGGIYGYTINSTTGALSALGSGGAMAITLLGSVSLDVSPDGQWLLALSQDGASLNEYQINTTGALSAAATPGYSGLAAAQPVPKMVKFSPSGTLVFVALGTGGDLVFPFNTTTGVVDTTPANVQVLSTGSSTTGDNALAIDAATKFLYIARSGTNNGIASFAIGANGALSSVTGSPFASGAGPFALVLDSTGKHLYAANRTDSTISGYTIGIGGVLTAVTGSPFLSGSTVNSLAVDNSGKYLLAAAGGGSPDLTMYSFDTSGTGVLTSVVTKATGTDPTQPVLVAATH